MQTCSRALAIVFVGVAIAALVMDRGSVFIIITCWVPLFVVGAIGLLLGLRQRAAASVCLCVAAISGYVALIAATRVQACVLALSTLPPFPFAVLPVYVAFVAGVTGLGTWAVVRHARKPA
ncbi:MAG TPA: hypothetical protein VK157_12615 [Phycisphaerales bacterium]|nr:hypothetical protein [Phycisphaerales bacterium]